MPSGTTDIVPAIFGGVIDAINDTVDAGQDLFDTITDFVSGNDDNDMASEIEHSIKKNVTLTDDETAQAIAWAKPLTADLGQMTYPRYPKGHAKAGEIMRIEGFKAVIDQSHPLGVRVNGFATEPSPGKQRQVYKKGFADGQKSRTKRKKVWT